jgi:phage shock protein PspC (stress-responsive transcriptional regulator)
MMKKIKDIVDRNAFGVCSFLGDKMGVASARVRIYFIYISFVTLGSPILLYLFAAFWLNVKDYIRERQSIFR